MNEQYRKQVALIVETLPLVAREAMFALKGGTAINLFYRDMPRFSVDIDLTYIGFEERTKAISNINTALDSIHVHCSRVGLEVTKQGSNGNYKLIVSNGKASIKIEPNYTVRGYIHSPAMLAVQPMVEKTFSWAEMLVGSPADVWGGKVCAALDRQHPRDLFDCEYLLASDQFDTEIIPGIVVMLLSHNKPLHELINPIIKDQRAVFQKEFAGMAGGSYTYENHERNMHALIERVQKILFPWKDTILDVYTLSSGLVDSPLSQFMCLPAIQWKVKNLEVLKDNDSEKFRKQVILLEEVFEIIAKGINK